MARVPDWRSDGIEASAWDVCWLGKHYLPGIVKIKVKKGRDVDVQKSPEVDGATSKNKGITPATVDIDFHVYDTPDAFAEWCDVLREIDPHKPGAAKEPYAILNPEPNHLGIDQIEILDIESESPTGKGGKNYKIKCQQWFPRTKPAKSKSTAQKKTTTPQPEIMLPSAGLNGMPNWIEKDQTVKNWVESNPVTGLRHDIPPFDSNSLP